MKCHFIVAVWGEPYLSNFLDVVLPNQLTPGNLGAFSDNKDCRYRIFTREIDRPRLDASQSVARLRELLAVDLVEVPGLGEQKEHPHQVYADMTRCHMRGVTDADDVGAAVVFLPADSLWSEGSFAALVGHYDAGMTAVVLPSIRLCAEPFREVFLDRFYDPSTGEAVAPARELIQAALPYLHPLMRACNVESEKFISWPSHLIWPVDDDGFIIRGFHLHPFMVNPAVKGVRFQFSLDYDYLTKACPDRERIHVVTDSDEILQVAIEQNDHRQELITAAAYRLDSVTSWAGEFTDHHHRWLITEHRTRIHMGDTIPEAWLPAERCSDLVAERIRVILGA